MFEIELCGLEKLLDRFEIELWIFEKLLDRFEVCLNAFWTLKKCLKVENQFELNRMKFQINKLVDGAYEELSDIYLPLLRADQRVQTNSLDRFEHDVSTPAIYHRLNLLPSTVLAHLTSHYFAGRDRRRLDIEEMVFNVAHRHDVCEQAELAAAKIVRRSALSQTLKNATSAGFRKGFVYSAAKLLKMFKSLR